MLFLVQLFCTLYMTGLIWFVQLVHYPMFANVPAESFVEYERIHQIRTTWAVAPMLFEAITAVLMLWYRPAGVSDTATWVGLGLVALLVGSTAIFFGPQHGRLATGFDAAVHRQLVDWNWVRTLGWTARSLLLLWILSTTKDV